MIKKVLPFMVLISTLLMACTEKEEKPEPIEPSTDESALIDRPINNKRFDDPNLVDRPMVQAHALTKTKVDDIYTRGYGGIVTNVAWNNQYLQDPRTFVSLEQCISHAIDDFDMHVWIYDEYGYPSGSAFGLTLKGNPEYEAMGLVYSSIVVNKGEQKTISLAHGHKEIISAYVYDGNETSIDISSGEDVSSMINSAKTEVTYRNPTNSSKVLMAFMSKNWYENTHATENWYAQQRYINMLDPEPTQKFISLTHDQYYEYLGDRFGDGIQAFFTDEPALQGNYFSQTARDRTVLDEPDPNVPIIECLNYSETLFKQFKNKYGYDLKEHLGHLYKNDGSKLGMQIRMDFYELTSDLFQQNYLGQTAKWCDAHKVKASGHLLLEELPYQNVWYAGNMVQLLGTMGIPGTDLLHSKASSAMKQSATTSKFASSAGDFLGKYDRFAEISDAFDNDSTRGDLYDQINAVGVQINNGVNIFSSYYYQGGKHTVEEDNIFTTAIGRMRYMTIGSEHRADMALYYPYEGVSSVTLPTKHMNLVTDEAKAVSEAFVNAAQTLQKKQIDYDIVDHINLDKCEFKDGYIITPNNEAYASIFVPFTYALKASTVNNLIKAAEAGVDVYIQDMSEVVCEKGQSEAEKLYKENVGKFINVTSPNKVALEIRNNKKCSILLGSESLSDIYASRRENKNYNLYTFVNAYTSDKKTTFNLRGAATKVKFYNSVTGDIIEIKDFEQNGSRVSFEYTLPANTTVFFVLEK